MNRTPVVFCATRPIGGTGGIMFSAGPSVRACVRVDAFSDRLAVAV